MMPRTNRRATRQRDTNVLQRLTQEVGDLKKRLKQSGSITVPITSLAPEPFELLQTIQVVVQPCEDEFVASFFDANVNASGSTETDALANLKDVMLAIFRAPPGATAGQTWARSASTTGCFETVHSEARKAGKED